jgi:hypothetical protein
MLNPSLDPSLDPFPLGPRITVSFLLMDYAAGLTNINNKTPGTASGRSRLVEPCAVAKS